MKVKIIFLFTSLLNFMFISCGLDDSSTTNKENIKKEDIKKVDVNKEDTKKVDINKEDTKKVDVNKEDTKKVDNNKEDTKKVDINKEDTKKVDVKKEDTKKVDVNKEDTKKVDVKKEDTKKVDVNKEDTKKVDINKEDTKKVDVNKEDTKKVDINKEDTKKVDVNKEDTKKVDIKKEDTKKVDVNKEDTKKVDINKEDTKKVDINKEDTKKVDINKEDTKKIGSKKDICTNNLSFDSSIVPYYQGWNTQIQVPNQARAIPKNGFYNLIYVSNTGKSEIANYPEMRIYLAGSGNNRTMSLIASIDRGKTDPIVYINYNIKWLLNIAQVELEPSCQFTGINPFKDAKFKFDYDDKNMFIHFYLNNPKDPGMKLKLEFHQPKNK